jgi:hypothetical protein
LSIIACQPHRLAVEIGNLMPDSLPCLEQRRYSGSEFWPGPWGAPTLAASLAALALHVLAYNLTRVVNIMGVRPPAAMTA